MLKNNPRRIDNKRLDLIELKLIIIVKLDRTKGN